MDAYVLLARNLVTGNGYTYAHMPSAWRTPGYPLVIFAGMELFGEHFPVAVRCTQILLALLAAWFCMRAARTFFGETAARITLLAGLYFPTLLYFSGEFLSESLSAFFVALFLWLFAEDSARPRWATAAGMGLAVGLGALFRPNIAVLGAVALLGAWLFRKHQRTPLQAALVPLCAVLVFVPWVIRNYAVFSRFVITTKSGTDALCGALNPESRFLPGWEDRMRALVGYLLPNELETNAPSRLALGPEIELNRRCWRAALQVWKGMGSAGLFRWTLGKWVTFWLGTDQLLEQGHISTRNRILRAAAVVFYWVLLAMACFGWWNLWATKPKIAAILLGYAVLVTVAHTPFVMNSRIRAPLIDPMIAVLAGGSVSAAGTGRVRLPET